MESQRVWHDWATEQDSPNISSFFPVWETHRGRCLENLVQLLSHVRLFATPWTAVSIHKLLTGNITCISLDYSFVIPERGASNHWPLMVCCCFVFLFFVLENSHCRLFPCLLASIVWGIKKTILSVLRWLIRRTQISGAKWCFQVASNHFFQI